MKEFLKAPLNNLIGLLLAVALLLAGVTGSGRAPALAPLTLGGANSGFTNFTGVNVKDGSLTAPGYGFTSETNSGLYRVGTNDAGWVVNGTKVLDVSATGLIVSSGSLTVTGGISRSVSLPIQAFLGCTGAAAYAIPFTNGADTKPELLNTTNVGEVLDFDVITNPDTDHACSNFMVPTDYLSGGVFRVEASKTGDTGATEIIDCAISINNAAALAAGTVTTSGTPAFYYTCTPTITGLAAGNSVGLSLWITSGATANDGVYVLAVRFEYLATQ